MRNTLIWVAGYLLAIPAGLGLALLLNQTVFGIRAIKSLFFFPFVISRVVIGLVFSWFFNPDLGLVEPLFRLFGQAPIAVLADEDWVTYAVVLAGFGCRFTISNPDLLFSSSTILL